MDNTAVLEPSAEREPGVPVFDETVWQEKMDAAGGPLPETESGELEEGMSINTALGLPESLEDLWPGHCYLAPSIMQLEKIIALGNSASEKFNNGDLFGSVNDGAELIKTLARRIEGEELVPVTAEEIKEEFDAEGLGRICHHILQQQGLKVEGVRGNSPSGRPIGALSFHSSAAITLTDLNTSDDSPTPSSELSSEP